MTQKTTLDAWTDVCQAIFAGRAEPDTPIHPIHSCIIGGKRHYIHAPALAQADPSYFERLKHFARKHGIRLKADRRAFSTKNENCRRKKLLPVIFLALGVNGVAASNTRVAIDAMAPTEVFKLNRHEERIDAEGKAVSQPPNGRLSAEIESVLTAHFVPQKDDPRSMADDLKRMARYYANHPEAVSLIQSISGADWELKYAPYTFQTDVQGSRLQVDDVAVYFDPRSGAKLKFYDKCSTKRPFCVASPADALLHELLHVQTIVTDTRGFIAQGGMTPHMYPASHERLTILKENILYKSMSQRDKKPRPIRSEHTGRHVLVSCVTCVD